MRRQHTPVTAPLGTQKDGMKKPVLVWFKVASGVFLASFLERIVFQQNPFSGANLLLVSRGVAFCDLNA